MDPALVGVTQLMIGALLLTFGIGMLLPRQQAPRSYVDEWYAQHPGLK
jgi:hypothetical protein